MSYSALADIPMPRKPTDTLVGGEPVPTEGDGPFETDLMVEGEPGLSTEDEVDDSLPI